MVVVGALLCDVSSMLVHFLIIQILVSPFLPFLKHLTIHNLTVVHLLIAQAKQLI